MSLHSQRRNAETLPFHTPWHFCPGRCGYGVTGWEWGREWRSDEPDPSGRDSLSLKVKQGYISVISHCSPDSGQDLLCALESPFIINFFTFNKHKFMHWEWQVVLHGILRFLFKTGCYRINNANKNLEDILDRYLSHLCELMLNECKATRSPLPY